jgi:hypothetical protein
VWFGSFLAGAGTSQAVCNPGSSRFGIPYDTVVVAVAAFALLCLAAAEIAAVLVFRATRSVEEQGTPPPGRMKFFAVAAMASNVIFAMIIVLATIATVVDRTCHQA